MQKAELARVDALLAKPLPALRTVCTSSCLRLNVLMRLQTPLEVLLARILSGSSAPKAKRRYVSITIVVDGGEAAALAPAPATSQHRGRASQACFLLPSWHGQSSHQARPLYKANPTCPARSYSRAHALHTLYFEI
jgi:hypothetical protein